MDVADVVDRQWISFAAEVDCALHRFDVAEHLGCSIVASPTAGVVNDRAPRKTIMIAADLVRFAIVLGMLLVRTPGMVWLVYPLLLLETIGAAFKGAPQR